MTAGRAEKRVALVIGNAVYKYADTLRNPAKDAKAIGAALNRLGFTGAKPRLNLDYNGLRQAFQDFSAEADGSDMAVLYFAGHGVEVDGRNFLIPVDAKLERSKAVEFETASLDQALNAVDGARQLRLIILDACRNNPFRARMLRSVGARSIGLGLRSIEPGGNVLVAYAAKHGTFALDGKGGNSPFAEALKDHIEKPGLEIGQLFREVRDDVLERTGREQEPHLYGSLGREAIYLKPPAPIGEDAERTPPGNGALPGPMPSAHPPVWLTAVIAGLSATVGALALALWLQQLQQPSPIRGAGDAPQTPTASADDRPPPPQQDAERLAKADDAAFAKARQAGTRAALIGYFKDYPQGRNVAAARAELTRLGFVEVAVGTANELRWFKAGGGEQDIETFKDCADCPEMVVAPAGNFMMGSPDTEKDRSSDEGPQHQVTIANPFAVGRFELTFAEWDACVAAGACEQEPEDRGWGRRGDRPVSNVSWKDISDDYLPWLSRKTGKTYRLLSEAEWEYAARAKTTGPFSFDGNITTDKANYNGNNIYDGSPTGEYRAKTVPVNTFAPNLWGLYQVHGNVWEWVQDCKTDYKETPRDGSAVKSTEGCARVLRGGSWNINPHRLRSADRSYITPSLRGDYIGFRVARTLTP